MSLYVQCAYVFPLLFCHIDPRYLFVTLVVQSAWFRKFSQSRGAMPQLP